jgi:hypothetical protein
MQQIGSVWQAEERRIDEKLDVRQANPYTILLRLYVQHCTYQLT